MVRQNSEQMARLLQKISIKRKLTERITDEIAKRPKNDFEVVTKLFEQAEAVLAKPPDDPSEVEKLIEKAKTPTPRLSKIKLSQSQAKLESPTKAEAGRLNRESLNQTWRVIKTSRVTREKLDNILKPRRVSKPEPMEAQLEQSLKTPLFNEPQTSAEILNKLLAMTEM